MDSLVSKCLDGPNTASTTTVVATTALATLTLVSLSRYMLWPASRPRVIPGPLTTYIPRVSPAEREKIAYHPDYYPGARDVPTPVSSRSVPSVRSPQLGDGGRT